ncbi:MAG: respiratory nitrate reductase subunit beta [Rhodospirillaceae bacterium]|jgi:complex iron-sulfur molybdoenzyme family reductase subunit beta|nr:respiratory nitrate reductase subunit beta [Rhodospirillaceae bacterium]|tara:strand:+ start:3595 stop:4638 length:1044 start_codon:yes stop_codon:yes gene_type:complete
MSKRQLAMVMDLNKCIGCQTCTMACKTQWTNRDGRDYMYWNNVETQPGSGYPRGWEDSGGGFDAEGDLRPGRIPSLSRDYGVPLEMNYEDALGMTPEGDAPPLSERGKDRPWLRPVERSAHGPNWDEDEGAGEYPNSYYFYLPRICNHCDDPACLEACPRQAIYKREEDGIVLIDQSRCRGYQNCIAACPYKKIYFNPLFKRSEKCIFCFPRVEQGLAPACARQCVGRIRFVGYLDDEESPVYKLVKKWKVALPLHAEFGTQPNVYYVPPLSPPKYDAEGRPTGERRIPDEHLIGLFGSRVPEVLKLLEEGREKKRQGEESELMDILIAYRHEEMFTLDADYYKKPG